MQKSLRFLTFFLFFILITTSIYAQNSIGIRGGIVSSGWVTKSSGMTRTSDRMTGVTFGVPFEFQISELFALQPELNYIEKGGIDRVDFSLIGFPIKAEQSIGINYFEIPLLGKLSFRSGKAKLDLLFGPSWAYGLSGSSKYSETINGNTQSDNHAIDFKKDSINRSDFSLNAGFGISFPTGNNRIFFDFRYQVGLTNLASPAVNGTTNDFDVKDHTLQFCMGFYFPLQSKPSGIIPMNPKKSN